MSEDIERVNYYQLEYLGAEDFKAEQAYHRDMRRRHNVAHHLLGIVTGLEILEVKRESGPACDTYIQPGLAIDGFGREIVVFAPYKLDAADFRSFTGDTAAPHEVWIGYREQLDTPPAAGYAQCDGEDQNKRVREDFRIVIDPPSPKHPAVIVGGKAAVLRSDLAAANAPAVIPDDESVPYQDLPGDESVRWLVCLGKATWNPKTGQFEVTAPATRIAGRVYTGVIAESVLSPSAKLFLRPRTFVAGNEDVDPFATIQGQLQVDGRIVAKKDVFLHGGRLSLQTAGGSDDNFPFWLQRKPPVGAVGYELHIDIGPEKGPQRLAIGTDGDDPAKIKSVLTVRADNNVDIPRGQLNFDATTPSRQMLNLSGADYGIGVQPASPPNTPPPQKTAATLYTRSVSDFVWYRGGVHDDKPAETGQGGTMVMKLDTSQLKVFGAVDCTTLIAQTVQANTVNAQTVNANTVNAQTVEANDVLVDGGKIHFRLPNGTDDSDELSIGRFHHGAPGSNSNDLRVIIGDDTSNDDAFTVGPAPGGTYKPNFRISNNGDVQMKGSLTLDAGKVVNIGTMRLGGNFPVDVVVVRHLLNVTNNASGFAGPFTFISRMPVVSNVSVVMALSDISNAGFAVNAAWSVFPASVVVNGNQVSYQIGYSVTDSDGLISFVSAIFVMVP